MKKLFAIFFSLAFVLCAFAETTEVKPVLSEGDVSSFIKNFSKLRAELEALDVDIDDTQRLAVVTGAVEKLKDTLDKYGLSGEDGVEKIRAIGLAYAIEAFNQSLAADPKATEMFKSLNFDPMALARSLVAPSDIELVKKYYDELVELFKNVKYG